MARVVFETTTILPPNPDKTNWEIAKDTFLSLYKDSPELQDLCWHVTVKENDVTGYSILHVSVDDPKQPSHEENVRLIWYLIGIAIIIGLLAYA